MFIHSQSIVMMPALQQNWHQTTLVRQRTLEKVLAEGKTQHFIFVLEKLLSNTYALQRLKKCCLVNSIRQRFHNCGIV